jgi:hypothetical protein
MWERRNRLFDHRVTPKQPTFELRDAHSRRLIV